ncbi:MAG: hypothetical protein COW03_13190 [Cytophagales bacterium CG12_big_fil_rev_8_21_14_0_65_40_12]|nr:MAG: hypothetical protein COW03_13190 [Cytophagales bacterium CG12_big_fil_rev_8_21_14_0_65_40_12]PIW03093.1 MAG: hypothetical protein COW40_17265 [Cytophagales bacterium CG17_big_fil_post_rev_8_21_14_2_50_40_13]
MKYKKPLLLVVIVLVILMMWQSFSQPGVGDLEGGFTEITSYRNENNTGPIIRVYIVTVVDTLLAEYKAYGNFMLHTKYGNTKVFFFDALKPFPTEVNANAPYFPTSFESNLLASYEKNASGWVHLRRY